MGGGSDGLDTEDILCVDVYLDVIYTNIAISIIDRK